MSEWKEYKLGEICDVRDGTHDSPKANPSGYPLVTSKNIKDGKIDLFNTYFISEADYKFVNQRSKVEQWDIIYSMIGTIGECAIVKDVPTFAIKNVGLFKTNGNQLLAQWIYYYLHSSVAQKELTGRIKGSTQQYISLTDLREFPIMIPPIDEQKRIAGVLSSLDDKIDLLNRENATLEALAETLFRHYFIEKPDPTWKEGKMGELITVSSGKGLKRTDFVDSGLYPILGANGEIGRTNEYHIGENENILYTGRVGTLGKVFRLENERAWLSDNTLIIKSINYYNYVYFLLKQANLQDYDVGSTQPLIRQSDIIDIDVIIPNNDSIVKFERETSQLFKKIKSNHQQMQTLAIQRDTLLPRLMSSEVKVVGQ